MRQDWGIARLILLNGPPGVGKSTLAHRYLDDHPMALLVEIDSLRVAMGGWIEHDESKLRARVLALALAQAHLDTGHDVIVPQYLGRPEFVDQLEAVARNVGAEFAHLVLADDRRAVVQRFRARREELLTDRGSHPEADLADAEIDAAVADAERRLVQMASDRTEIDVVDLSDADPYSRVIRALR